MLELFTNIFLLLSLGDLAAEFNTTKLLNTFFYFSVLYTHTHLFHMKQKYKMVIFGGCKYKGLH